MFRGGELLLIAFQFPGGQADIIPQQEIPEKVEALILKYTGQFQPLGGRRQQGTL